MMKPQTLKYISDDIQTDFGLIEGPKRASKSNIESNYHLLGEPKKLYQHDDYKYFCIKGNDGK